MAGANGRAPAKTNGAVRVVSERRPPVPCDLDAEIGMLGECCLRRSTFDACAAVIRGGDFFSEANTRVWSAMTELYAAGADRIGSVELAAALRDRGQLGAVGMPHLADVFAAPVCAAPAAAARLAELGRRRRAIAQVQRMEMELRSGTMPEGWATSYPAGLASIGEGPTSTAIQWLTRDQLEAPAEEPDWVQRELGLCPGRPGLLIGMGYSGKSIFAAGLALAMATGTRFLGQFYCREAIVCHLDYEMGERPTRRRYHRLCNGLGIDWAEAHQRLRIACRPRLSLTDPDAERELERALKGARLCIVDSLRRAVPGIDENDSRITMYLDLLARVSERVGCAVLVLHHASTKPSQPGPKDLRAVGRGSSAIFDAAGSYIVMESSGPGEPAHVQHVREPQEGRTFVPFHVAIEDVAGGGDPKAGLALRYMTPEQATPPTSDTFASLKAEVVAVVRRHRELTSANAICARATGNKAKLLEAIRELQQEGRLFHVGGCFRAS